VLQGTAQLFARPVGSDPAGRSIGGIARLESDGTRRRTGGEVKGKYANGVGSQQSCTASEDGLSRITTADAHASAASSRLN